MVIIVISTCSNPLSLCTIWTFPCVTHHFQNDFNSFARKWIFKIFLFLHFDYNYCRKVYFSLTFSFWNIRWLSMFRFQSKSWKNKIFSFLEKWIRTGNFLGNAKIYRCRDLHVFMNVNYCHYLKIQLFTANNYSTDECLPSVTLPRQIKGIMEWKVVEKRKMFNKCWKKKRKKRNEKKVEFIEWKEVLLVTPFNNLESLIIWLFV